MAKYEDTVFLNEDEFTPDFFKEILSFFEEDEYVCLSCTHNFKFEKDDYVLKLEKKNNLMNTLYSKEIVNGVKKYGSLTISNQDTSIAFNITKEDYLKYKTSTKQKELFGLKEEKKKSKSFTKLFVACAVRDFDNNILDPHTFIGDSKEIIQFINNELQIRSVEVFFSKYDIIFALDKDTSEVKLEDRNLIWKTTMELIENQIFIEKIQKEKEKEDE